MKGMKKVQGQLSGCGLPHGIGKVSVWKEPMKFDVRRYKV